MRSQHWFRSWLGAVRQQAITWANVDLDLCHHIAYQHLFWSQTAVECELKRRQRESQTYITVTSHERKVSTVCSTVCSKSALLTVDSLQKGSAKQRAFPYHDIIMKQPTNCSVARNSRHTSKGGLFTATFRKGIGSGLVRSTSSSGKVSSTLEP